MRFENTTASELNFEIGGVSHKVAGNGEFELHSKFAYAVKSLGLPLKPAAGQDDRQDDHIPESPDGKLWYERAHAVRTDLDVERMRRREAEDNAAALEGELAGATVRLEAMKTLMKERDDALRAESKASQDLERSMAALAKCRKDLEEAHALIDSATSKAPAAAPDAGSQKRK